jgi:hypothetical protein
VVRFVYQKNKIRARDQQAVQQEEAASLLTPTCQIVLQTYPGDNLADLYNTISSLTITSETSNHLRPPADSITTLYMYLVGTSKMRNNASYGSSTSLSQQLALSSRWLRQVLLDSMSQPWSRETIDLIETIRVSMAGCGQHASGSEKRSLRGKEQESSLRIGRVGACLGKTLSERRWKRKILKLFITLESLMDTHFREIQSTFWSTASLCVISGMWRI